MKNFILGGIIGLVLSVGGITYLTWEFWVIILAVAGMGVTNKT